MKCSNSKAQKILVVHDEPSIRRLFTEILAIEGFNVDIATHETKAKLKLDKRDNNIFIIDIKMPGINSTEIYEYIADKFPEMVNRIVFTSGDVIGGDTELFQKRLPSHSPLMT